MDGLSGGGLFGGRWLGCGGGLAAAAAAAGAAAGAGAGADCDDCLTRVSSGLFASSSRSMPCDMVLSLFMICSTLCGWTNTLISSLCLI